MAKCAYCLLLLLMIYITIGTSLQKRIKESSKDCAPSVRFTSQAKQGEPGSRCPLVQGDNKCNLGLECCNEVRSGNAGVCADIDECSTGAHNCHLAAICHNNIGAYTCECRDGFVGNGTSCEARLYWSQENIENYLRVTDMPALSEFTACFYYEPNHVGDIEIAAGTGSQGQFILSVASRSNDNEFLLGFYESPSRGIRTQSNGAHTITEGLEAFTEAHRHCFVWKDSHFLKWFYDMNTSGVLELSAQVGDSGGENIPAGSIMAILNEQDTFGGGFSRNQMIPGNIADFQMWDRAFSNNEVRALRCEELGNVVTFSDIDTVGTASYRQGSNFRCSNRN